MLILQQNRVTSSDLGNSGAWDGGDGVSGKEIQERGFGSSNFVVEWKELCFDPLPPVAQSE